jgi:hypothetical protein
MKAFISVWLLLIVLGVVVVWASPPSEVLNTYSEPLCSDLAKEMGSPLPKYAICRPYE